MKMWQFCGLMSAIYLASHKPGPVNVGIGLLFSVAMLVAAVMDK